MINFMHLSPSIDPSPSLEADDPCLDNLTSPGSTSSDLCTVNDVFPLLPKPILRFLPVFSHGQYKFNLSYSILGTNI